jgi:hypothetical protein
MFSDGEALYRQKGWQYPWAPVGDQSKCARQKEPKMGLNLAFSVKQQKERRKPIRVLPLHLTKAIGYIG